MSFKQSIAALIVLFSVSFSAYSTQYATAYIGSSSQHANRISNCWNGGDRFTPLNIGVATACAEDRWLGEDIYGDSLTSTTCYIEPYSTSLRTMCNTNKSPVVIWTWRTFSCPSGLVFDNQTGMCKSLVPYCEQDSTLEEILNARNECEAQGNEFSYSCSDETESWQSFCEKPQCDFGENSDGSCKTACQYYESIDETRTLTWHPYVYGSSPTGACYGSSSGMRCEMVRSGASVCAGLDNGSIGPDSSCSGTFAFNGSECSGNDFWGDLPTEPPPTNPEDPNHKPDDPTGGDIEDPSVLPDSDSTPLPNPNPDDVEKPDVENPETTPETDTAVLSAIKGMNADINDSLHALNGDVNQASVDIRNELKVLNASIVKNSQTTQEQQKNDNVIYEKTKALIQQANADITTAVNRTNNSINALGDEVGLIAGSMDGIAEDVSGISDFLDGVANTDTSGAGVGGTCIESGSCTGFYESGYPDGLGGMTSEHLAEMKDTVLDGIVGMFNLDLSNASRPSFSLPLPYYDNQDFDDYVNFDWIFGFIKVCILVTAVFSGRRIIFGG
ncbi:methyl-accepting chemotaxis protein [Vibrio sp. PID23_8]|uniref:methyl-accepting chemotaxis protein n=1 Tax=Vibrio sp. PID23_8 TaxID=1583767 RepID=UPI000E67A1A1|nr:methyl-accepting chemotaxis protein [Vibrio sp. PID23_8]